RSALGGRDQVERSQFIVLPPAPPVRQLGLPGFELCLAHERTGRRSLGGGVADKGRGEAEGANKDRDCPRECQRVAHDVSLPVSVRSGDATDRARLSLLGSI